MNLISKTMYNSPCMYNNAYKRIIKPKGAFLHSIGCPCEKAQNIYNNWNKSSATAGVQALIQADGDIWTTLPVYFDTKSAIRNWHGGKNASNDNYIGVEMMEPASIKYTGGANWIETGDGSHTKAHVLSTNKYAVEYFAYLCDGFGWKPLAAVSYTHLVPMPATKIMHWIMIVVCSGFIPAPSAIIRGTAREPAIKRSTWSLTNCILKML